MSIAHEYTKLGAGSDGREGQGVKALPGVRGDRESSPYLPLYGGSCTRNKRAQGHCCLVTDQH
ncbi:MAG: hypothetical protein ACMUIL_05525 [bacterium]